MSTNILAWAAKRALVDRIDTLLSSDTVQVAYAFPGDPQRLCVYGGALRFTQDDAVAETGVLAQETATIDIWIRCNQPGDDVRGCDVAVENLADQIVGDLSANPKLTGALTTVGVALGDAGQPVLSPGPEPSTTSQVLLQIVCEGYV
jgi:hypothetical protein